MSSHVPVGKIVDLFPSKKVFEVTPFRVYHSGWECDEWGYQVSFLGPDGYREKIQAVVFTDHGSPYIVSEKELDSYISKLESAVAEADYAKWAAFPEQKSEEE
jgi:hypothetical protein